MADDIDTAADRIEAFTARALAAVVDRPQAPLSTGICKDCGEAIEPDRLAVNPRAQRYAECEADVEAERQRAKRRGW